MNRSILKYSFFKKLRRMHLITDQRYHSIIRPGYEYIARSEYFNEAYFCSRYGDLFPRGQNPISYYLSGGWRDAPCTSPLFDGAKYLRRHEDVRKAACPPLSLKKRAGLLEPRLRYNHYLLFNHQNWQL